MIDTRFDIFDKINEGDNPRALESPKAGNTDANADATIDALESTTSEYPSLAHSAAQISWIL